MTFNEKQENQNIKNPENFYYTIQKLRGSALYDELQGMDQLNKYLKETKNVEGDEEYCTIFNYFINNFESIIMEKKPRNRKSQNNN